MAVLAAIIGWERAIGLRYLFRDLIVQCLEVFEDLGSVLFDVALLVANSLQLFKDNASPLLGRTILIRESNLVLDGSLVTVRKTGSGAADEL